MSDIFNIIWIFFLLQAFLPLLSKQLLLFRRQSAMKAIETKRKSRVITMIHRQETMSLLGFPVARYIDIEDSWTSYGTVYEFVQRVVQAY